jgi:hypothetical protein
VSRLLRVLVLLIVASLGPAGVDAARADAPSGQMTLVYNISIVPRWLGRIRLPRNRRRQLGELEPDAANTERPLVPQRERTRR